MSFPKSARVFSHTYVYVANFKQFARNLGHNIYFHEKDELSLASKIKIRVSSKDLDSIRPVPSFQLLLEVNIMNIQTIILNNIMENTNFKEILKK